MDRTADPLGALRCVTARDILARQALTELTADAADPRLVSIAGALSDVRPMLRTLQEIAVWAQEFPREAGPSNVLAPVEGTRHSYSYRPRYPAEAEAVLRILNRNLTGQPISS